MSLTVPRRVLLALAIAAGALSGGLYYASTQRADVVVAARDITETRVLTLDDLEVRTVAAELTPEGAVHRLDEAVGTTLRVPVVKGQVILIAALATDVVELGGRTLDDGARAIALPVRAVDAVGGAILPGSRVDVLAIPVPGRAPADRTAEVLVTGVPVLDIRTESGAAVDGHGTKGIALDRMASVVIAISLVDEARIADRIATSTFVLALVGSR